SDPDAEQYLIRTLIERRNKIGKYYFNRVLAIDNFAATERAVQFAFVPSQFDFANEPGQYALSWFRLDNLREEKTFVGGEVLISQATADIPPQLLEDSTGYFGVEIREVHEAESKEKGPSVSLYMSRFSPVRIVGIERTGRVK